MLSNGRIHDLFVDHAEGIFLLDLVNDGVLIAPLRLFLPAECFIVEILVIEVLDHVRW